MSHQDKLAAARTEFSAKMASALGDWVGTASGSIPVRKALLLRTEIGQKT